MIKEIRYKNFKALRDTTLPLGRFTLIVGANGTGKSTALKALEIIKTPQNFQWKDIVSVEAPEFNNLIVSIEIKINKVSLKASWTNKIDKFGSLSFEGMKNSTQHTIRINGESHKRIFNEWIADFNLYQFDAEEIAQPTQIKPNIEIKSDGGNLSGVLLQMQTSEDERFEELNKEIQNWFPEFNRIVFEFPEDGKVSFLLRTKFGRNKIKAQDLSDGTRLALAYLTLAYLPNPPKIVAFEEPEKGIHPRLLRNIQEAMDRLAYPENFGENREPIQVIATTHSPYLLDLYKDRREEIVIADKDENGVHFQNLAEMKNIDKILQGGEALGEVWFTGVLGGVPAHI